MNNKSRFLLATVACCFQLGIVSANEPKPSDSALPMEQQQQKSAKIIGIVTDSKTGETIIGATIQTKGKSNGVITDIDGKFEISASPKDELVISYIGYVTKEVKVGAQKLLAITLVEDAKQLEEVVVTAFGSGQKKESITGSIQSIRPSDLIVPSANLSTSFAGRLAGVVAYQRSGEPGQNGSDFFIRGIATFNGSTPLIIMDGVEISKGDLNAIDPEIIESFSVLKDASASAMYGSRGANGVMIIKSKSGSDVEKPIIGARLEANVTMSAQTPKFVGAVDYMRMYNEAVTNQGTGDILYTEDQVNGTINRLDPYIYPDVDWYNEIFKGAAFNQKANFNIRGGTQKITYFMNLNVNHETGMLKNRSEDFYSFKNNINILRYSFQNNIDFHLSKSSTISLRLNAQINDNHGPNSEVKDIFGAIMTTNPVNFPVMFPKSADESWYRWGSLTGGNAALTINPLARTSNGYYDSFESTVTANIDFEQKLDFITEGLAFKTMFSFKNWSKSATYRNIGNNSYYLAGHSKNEAGGYDYDVRPIGEPTRRSLTTNAYSQGDRRMYFQAYLDYNRSFGDHNVSGMVLFNEDEYNKNNAAFNSGDPFTPFGNSLDRLFNSLPKRKMGFAARATYDYARRYMLEFNAGYNGSENFAKGHRFGFFPSVSLGWNLSEESFWSPIKNVVSNFKLRGSYGLVGNDQVTDTRFLYLAMVNLTGGGSYETGWGTNYEGNSGPSYIRFQNENISWEVGHKLNIGADIQLFNSLNLTFDGFQEIRSDIFQKKSSIPGYLGTTGTTIYGNFAKVKNWGFDVSASYGKQFNKDLSLQFQGTFTFARNKVLEYDEAPGLRSARSMVGKNINQMWGFVSDGLYIDQADVANNPTSTLGNIAIAPGDIKYVDQPDKDGNYDGKITDDDMVPLGSPHIPEIVYGFGPSLTWKKWDFSVFFQGQAKVSLMMSGFAPFGTQLNRNVLQWIADDYWSADNQDVNAAHPRLTKYDNNHNMKNSDYWLRNAAFLKLKNAEVGYNFKFARVYVNGANLLTFSPFKHWDPELGNGKGLTYPLQRTFNIGIQLNFK